MTTAEVTAEFTLSCPGWALQTTHPLVLPIVTTVDELRSLVNGMLSEGSPRDDWLFRANGLRILTSIVDTTEQLIKFNTEDLLKIDVLLPLGVEFESTLETPDALVKIISQGSKLVCLGSRGNVSIFERENCKGPPTAILHSEEPNAVDLLRVDDDSENSSYLYWQMSACGVVSRTDTVNETIDIEGKIDVIERITAAAVRPDRSLVIVGDANGSVFFYLNPNSKKRTAETADRCAGAFNWTCVKPALSRQNSFRQPVTHIDLIEDQRGFIAAISSLDGSIKVFDSLDGEILNVFNTGNSITAYARVGPDLILTGHIDGKCKLWRFADLSIQGSGRLTHLLTSQSHRRAITDVAYLQNWNGRDMLVTAGNDRCICLADATDGHVEHRFDLMPSAQTADAKKQSLVPSVGPVGDYGVFPTALLVNKGAIFVGTNNNRVHYINLKK